MNHTFIIKKHAFLIIFIVHGAFSLPVVCMRNTSEQKNVCKLNLRNIRRFEGCSAWLKKAFMQKICV